MTTHARIWSGPVVLGLIVGIAAGTRADDKSTSAAGVWTWTVKRGDREGVVNTLKLKQDGEALSGSINTFGHDSAIADGKADKDGNVSFVVTREFNGNAFKIKYKGKVEGDALKLKVEFERDGETRTREFEAKRQAEKA